MFDVAQRLRGSALFALVGTFALGWLPGDLLAQSATVPSTPPPAQTLEGPAAKAVSPDSWLFGGSGDEIYRIDTDNLRTAEVADVGRGFSQLFDVAFLPDGRLFGVLSTGGFIEFDLDAGTGSSVGSTFADTNALIAETPTTFYGATSTGSFLRIDAANASTQIIGSYGANLGSAGDLAIDFDGTLYGIVHQGACCNPAFLATINRGTGAASLIGPVGFNDVFGLAFGPGGTLYAVADGDSTPTLLTLDKATGTGSVVGSLADVFRMGGLASRFVPGSLVATGALIVPGFEVDTLSATGPSTLFAVRNTTTASLDIEVQYFGSTLTTTPQRSDRFNLPPRRTLTRDVRGNLGGLDVVNGTARGLILIRSTAGPADDLVGDYLRLDVANAFASGDRLVRGKDFCDKQEIRYVDFGSGTELQILVNLPTGSSGPSFEYSAFDEQGQLITQAAFITSQHLNVVDLGVLVPPSESFGTLVFDFTASGGGWVSAKYSAFGQFSAELNADCRD